MSFPMFFLIFFLTKFFPLLQVRRSSSPFRMDVVPIEEPTPASEVGWGTHWWTSLGLGGSRLGSRNLSRKLSESIGSVNPLRNYIGFKELQCVRGTHWWTILGWRNSLRNYIGFGICGTLIYRPQLQKGGGGDNWNWDGIQTEAFLIWNLLILFAIKNVL